MAEIEQVKKNYQNLLQQLSDPEVLSDLERFQSLSRRKAQLQLALAKLEELSATRRQIEENQSILEAGEDHELNLLAQEELRHLLAREKNLQAELEKLLPETETKETSSSSLIMEIRAGVGGEESALFARDLFRMYSNFAQKRGWLQTVLDSSPSQLGGLKEIVFELKPGKAQAEERDIFSQLRWEAGVHRVQRIPLTEKAGRTHTSTATVAVLAKPREAAVKIREADIKIEFFNAPGPGGQNVNKRKTAVRIIHLPSQMVVTSRTERSQRQNRENAMSILAARLLEKEQLEKESQVLGERKAQIGWAKRAEKIRTYNFPQDRLTDHRLKKSWHNLEAILEGKLEDVVKTLSEKAPAL